MFPRNSRLAVAMLCLFALCLTGFDSSSKNMKATWVWQTSLIENSKQDMLDYAQDKGINLIYLQIDRYMPYEPYQQFISDAGQLGIEVHALGGDPRWALEQHKSRMLGLIDWVEAYNRASTPSQQFTGLHLDIEPYVLPNWEVEQDTIIHSWIANLEAFLDRANQVPELELGIDIPFWFDYVTLADHNDMLLNEWMMRSFDHVTIMAYRNAVQSEYGILELVSNEMRLADELGTPSLIAVNTKQMPAEQYTSFYGSDEGQLDLVLNELTEALGSRPSYAGVAVHDYVNWRAMASAIEHPAPAPDEEEEQPAPVPDEEEEQPAPVPDEEEEQPAPVPDEEEQPAPAPDEEEEQPAPVPDEEEQPAPVPDEEEEQPAPIPDETVDNDRIRGMYVWEANQVIHEADDVIAFANEQRLNWLYIRLDLQQPYEVYRDFIRKAAGAGIEVHALAGHPRWAFEENRYRIKNLIDYVKQYNEGSAPEERLYGIHLDIEPYTQAEWSTDHERLLREWMNNISYFVEETGKESNLQTSADLAVWLDKYTAPGTDVSFSYWMLQILDHVTLMAFRDQADGPGGIADVIKEELAFAKELGKPLIIAVEMKQSYEGDHITFYEEGSEVMEEEVGKLQDILKDSLKYWLGHVVHAYDYWRQAKK